MMEVKSYKGMEDKHVSVGLIDNDTYRTERKKHHFFRIFQGFAISNTIIEDLLVKNVKDVVITYYGNNRIKYRSSLKDWIEKGEKYQNKIKDGTDDLQIVLSVRFMNEE